MLNKTNTMNRIKKTLTITSSNFDGLINNVICDEANTHLLGFKSEYNKYSISFHARQENNWNTEIEDFGLSINKQFLQFTPTQEQTNKITQIIDNKRYKLSEAI